MIEVTEPIRAKLRPFYLEMLVEFDRICQKYDIQYSLGGGH